MSLILYLSSDNLLGTYFLHFPCWEGDKKKCVSKNYDSEFEIEWNPFIMVSFTTCALGNRTKLLYKSFCPTFIKRLPHGISKRGRKWAMLYLGLATAVKSEKAMAPHSSTLAWKIPWMEEPGRLQSMGSLRVGHDWATLLSLFTFMHWRRTWQPTPVFLPGESQGQGSLVGCRLWGRTESDTTEAT